MNLVFGAEGLNVGEGAFLMACCNHTDNRGYVIASMQQLADEAHLGMTAAKANKQRLIKRGLLAAAERLHPKNKARIADLYRVNIDLLTEMQRRRKDYGPTLVEELTFEAPEENPSSDPPSDSDLPPGRIPTGGGRNPTGGGSDLDGTPPADSAPLLPPSSPPSSLSPAPSVTPEPSTTADVTAERENSATPDKTTTPAASAVVKELAERWKDKRGTRPGRRQLQAVEADVVESLEDGDALEWLVASVVPFMVGRGYLDFARAKTHPQCPPPTGAALPGQRPAVPDWCTRCNDGRVPENVGERFRRLPSGAVEKCPDCHPGAVRQHADA